MSIQAREQVLVYRIENRDGLGLMRGPRSADMEDFFDFEFEEFFPSWQCEYWADRSGETLGYGRSAVARGFIKDPEELAKALHTNPEEVRLPKSLRAGVLDVNTLKAWFANYPYLDLILEEAGYGLGLYEADPEKVLFSSSGRPKQIVFDRDNADLLSFESALELCSQLSFA